MKLDLCLGDRGLGNGMKRNFFLKEYSFHSLVGEFNRRE